MKLKPPETDVQDTLLALIQNRSLTSIELRQMTKSSYPPARIKNVCDLGISIITTREPYVNRRGVKTSVARYLMANTKSEAEKIYMELVKKDR